MKSYEAALREATEDLQRAGVPEAELSAWYLLEEAVRQPVGMEQFDRAYYLLHKEDGIDEAVADTFASFVEYRKKRVPLEYITHRTEFMGLTFFVDSRVLIPRQDTECLVEEALKYSEGADVLDLCTGSGCIAVSLASLGRPRSVTASDRSAEALSVAERNAKENGVSVTCVHSDLWEDIAGDYDLITCNPPYIRQEVIPTLMPEVREYEPVMALIGGEDGLDFYRKILAGIGVFLRRNGHLIFEIGYDQGEDVAGLMRDAGLTDVRVRKDLAGMDRVVSGRWKNEEICCR